MSLAEVTLILAVAAVALGPKQFPLLIQYFTKLMVFYRKGRSEVKQVLELSLQEKQLDENLKKAQKADEMYKKKS